MNRGAKWPRKLILTKVWSLDERQRGHAALGNGQGGSLCVLREPTLKALFPPKKHLGGTLDELLEFLIVFISMHNKNIIHILSEFIDCLGPEFIDYLGPG